jgi:hypothetical protein
VVEKMHENYEEIIGRRVAPVFSIRQPFPCVHFTRYVPFFVVSVGIWGQFYTLDKAELIAHCGSERGRFVKSVDPTPCAAFVFGCSFPAKGHERTLPGL